MQTMQRAWRVKIHIHYYKLHTESRINCFIDSKFAIIIMVAICDLDRYRCDHQSSVKCMVPDRSAIPTGDPRFSADRCAGFPRRPDKPQAVNTSTLYTTLNLPVRFEKSCRWVGYVEGKCINLFFMCWPSAAWADVFKGYGVQVNEGGNPLYQTTSNEYGWFTPNAHTVPQR